MMHRSADGFDLDAALEALIEKYGQEEVVTKKSPSKKRKGENENDDESAPGSNKKVKKTDIVANEGNRSVAEAIKEMADLNYKNKDMRKGGMIWTVYIDSQANNVLTIGFVMLLLIGVFSKAAKAIRECETEITTLKEAMALKGVGKGIAGYIMEKIETGNIEKLEELRSGYA